LKLLLDTCTFLWIALDAPELSAAARKACLDRVNQVYFSSVSAWEIAVKHSLGKLPLPESPARFIPFQRERHEIEALPLDEVSVLSLPKLPELHRDPFDRMLLCQAIANGLDLVTPDPLITQYPVRVLW
jgi:PIN domain nuclease of toxin-antitoxin system